MPFPEIIERLLHLLKLDRSTNLRDEVVAIQPRSLSEIELDWVRSILSASIGWETADISKTKVVAEGPSSEGILYVLQASTPENPSVQSVRNSVANLWIHTADQVTINVQLAEWKGWLQHLYVLVIDRKHPRRVTRTLPSEWVEKSREAVGFGA